MGIAAACELADRGLRVVGLDRFTPPHDRGAHAGRSRIFRTAYMEGAAYVPLAREALRRWRSLESETGTDLLTLTGGLMLGRPDSGAVSGALATATAYDLRHELLDGAEVRRRFPAFTPADDEVGLWEEAAGFVRPEAAIGALTEAARRRGADLRTGMPVTSWTAGPDGVTVHCGGHAFEADRLVLALGAWAPGLAGLEVPMRVERRVQHFFRPTEPSACEPGRMPVWVWERDDVAYGMPLIEGRAKGALHHHRAEQAADPEMTPGAVTASEVEAMQKALDSRIPSLARGEWIDAKPCLYTLTPDENFVLGLHPLHPAVAVACGFSGHGFKFTPAIGAILADLVVDGRTGFDITLFDPQRFVVPRDVP